MKINYFLSIAVFIIITVLVSNDVKAQKTEQTTYKTGIGLKVWPFAVDFKTFVGQRNRAIELIAYFDDGFQITGLYEFHGDLNANKSLKWYIGLGGHGGFYEKGDEDGITAGFDGAIGLDYKFKGLPLALALDWQPSLELVTPKTEFQGNRGGLAIRFAF